MVGALDGIFSISVFLSVKRVLTRSVVGGAWFIAVKSFSVSSLPNIDKSLESRGISIEYAT